MTVQAASSGTSHKRKLIPTTTTTTTKMRPAATNDGDNNNGKAHKNWSIYLILPRLIAGGTVLLLLVAITSVFFSLQEAVNRNNKQSNYNSIIMKKAQKYLEQVGQKDFCQNHHNNSGIVTPLNPPLSTQHDLIDILEGPALDPRILEKKPLIIVACKLFRHSRHHHRQPGSNITNSTTIHHNLHSYQILQQIYRCVSWWNYHRERRQQQQQQQDGNATMELLVVWPKALPKNGAFLLGILESLRKLWNVKVVPLRGKTPIVRPRVDYGFPHHNHKNKSQARQYGFQTKQVRDLQRLRQDIIEFYHPQRYKVEQLRSLLLPETSGMALKPATTSLSSTTTTTTTKPRITILNRPEEAGRFLLNADELLRALQKAFLDTAQIQLIPHFENVTFLQRVLILAETDLLISPHGPQLTALMFLPRCSVLLELFGRGFLWPEYYGSLAAASGVLYRHVGGDSLEFWMKDAQSVEVAQVFPICAPIDTIVNYVQKEIQQWQKRVESPAENCL